MEANGIAPQASRDRTEQRLTFILVWAAGFCLLVLLLSHVTHASITPTGAGVAFGVQGDWLNYTNVDHIRAIAVVTSTDTVTHAWVATDGGVASWNLKTGCRVTHTTASGLPSNDVLCVQVDSQGRPWFGTPAGVSVIIWGHATPCDLTDDVWAHYTTADGLVSNYIRSIGIPRNATNGDEYKWFGTNYGLTVFDDSEGTLRTRSYGVAEGLAGIDVTAIAVSDTGEVWCGTEGGVTVLRADDPLVSATLQTYTISNTALASNRVWDIALYGGEVWVATDAGLSRRNADGSWESYYPNGDNQLPTAEMRAVQVDGQGNVWIVLGTDQVAVFRRVGRWPIYTVPCGATSATYDGGQDMFFGTVGCGIYALNAADALSDTANVEWRDYRSGLGPISNKVSSVAVVSDVMLCGTWDRGASVSDTAWSHYSHSDGLGSNRIGAVAFDADGRKWVGTQRVPGTDMPGGLCVLDDTAVTPPFATCITDVLPLEYVFSLATISGTNHVWAGTDQGAVFIDHRGTPTDTQNALSCTFTTSDGLLSNMVNAIAISSTEDGALILFGTEGGLSRLDAGSTPCDKGDDRWETHVITDGLASLIVYDVAVARDEPGYIWLATNSGLSVLHDGGAVLTQAGDICITYTVEDGLAHNWVRDLARDREGWWWVATAVGLNRFWDNRTPCTKTDDIWITYTTADGLAGSDVSGVDVDPETGQVWCATNHGLSQFLHGEPTPLPTATPTVTLTPTPPTVTPPAYKVRLPIVLKQITLTHGF